ncbi:hypothetical protein [Roseospira navarrensis]|uniref:Uncharacterized protein n=1 Tax=Roseospira navarrensis TaxID=140058 RepID=A0A7X1ZFL6_9PROT|nr:hypothetical protein [Roseospira navarrensis]MQX37428.1 hypothetical protein [Roseospira navarrensis]
MTTPLLRLAASHLKDAAGGARDLWRLRGFLRRPKVPGSGTPAEALRGLRGRYFVSTDRGIYLATRAGLSPVLPFGTFGVGVEDGTLYASVNLANWSLIVAGAFHDTPDGIRLDPMRVVYQLETKYHSDRIHQIYVRNRTIYVANTRKNSVDLVDADSGALKTSLYPITDASGFPISADQNHLNSVYAAGDVLWFTTHNGGHIGSLLGFMDGTDVVTAGFPNRGVHDIVPTSQGLVFSDTFGSKKARDLRGGGNLYIGRTPQLPTDSDLGYVVRGVAGRGDEMLIGHSLNAKRQDRFKGNGGLLVGPRGGPFQYLATPFSQVYDIVRLDGGKLDDEIPAMTSAEAERLLADSVGPVTRAAYHITTPSSGEFVSTHETGEPRAPASASGA